MSSALPPAADAARGGVTPTKRATPPPPAKPQPGSVAFTVGNTYRRLSPTEASYGKRTVQHLKVHNWTLYVNVLVGQDPDIINRVMFDMRDDSFATMAFMCYRAASGNNTTDRQ